MKTFIATFYSHFAAVQFKKKIDLLGPVSRLMPVPRSLSSSCGICVKFTADDGGIPDSLIGEELEQIVQIDGAEYVTVYRASAS